MTLKEDWPEDVEVCIQKTFVHFYQRITRTRDETGATEKLFRSHSEGSFGSLRSDSTEDTTRPSQLSVEIVAQDADSASASAETWGEASPVSGVAEVHTASRARDLHNSGGSKDVDAEAWKGMQCSPIPGSKDVDAEQWKGTQCPPIPGSKDVDTELWKGKGQGLIEQKDSETPTSRYKKGTSKNSKKRACRSTLLESQGRPSGSCRSSQKGGHQENASSFTSAISNLVKSVKPGMRDAAYRLSDYVGCAPPFSIPPFSDFKEQELVSTMWGLSKLAEKYKSSREDAEQMVAEQILISLLEAAKPRVDDFYATHLATGIYSMALYRQAAPSKAGTDAADSFATACAQGLSCSKRQRDLQSQGVANALWAAGRLPNLGVDAENLCIAVAKGWLDGRGALEIPLQPQELSMALLGISKIVRQKKTKPDRRVTALAMGVLSQATATVEDQAPQGLSNIALAVVNLKLHTRPEGQSFLLRAAGSASKKMHTETFSPQAVSNLCSAVAKLGEHQEVLSFLEIAVLHASAEKGRFSHFQWHDLSEIVTAISPHAAHSETLRGFAAKVLAKAARGVAENVQMQAQTLLIIAHAGAQMGLDKAQVRRLGERIADQPPKSLARNDKWRELQRYCHSESQW